MNQSFGAVVRGPLSPMAMYNFLRSSVMPERRDWNAMGPALPGWFRAYLRRIDPMLVLQFVPPRTHAKGGCDPAQHPFGVWAICRRMPTTGWLAKRWVYSMSTPEGLPLAPTRDLVELLIRTRDLCRRDQAEQLENHFDRHMAEHRKTLAAKSKERMHQRIEQRLRERNVILKPRISLAGLSSRLA